QLQETSFAAARLAGAQFCEAELVGTRFTNADLTRADFSGAILADADFVGAVIDDANFQDAVLVGANFSGLDVSRAKNLDPGQTANVGKAGPKMLELENVAKKSKRLETTAIVESRTGKCVELTITSIEYGRWVQTRTGGKPSLASFRASSFSAGMLNLVKRW